MIPRALSLPTFSQVAQAAIAHCDWIIGRCHNQINHGVAPTPCAPTLSLATDAAGGVTLATDTLATHTVPTDHAGPSADGEPNLVTLADGDAVPDWLFNAAMRLRPDEVATATATAAVAAERRRPARRTRKVYD